MQPRNHRDKAIALPLAPRIERGHARHRSAQRRALPSINCCVFKIKQTRIQIRFPKRIGSVHRFANKKVARSIALARPLTGGSINRRFKSARTISFGHPRPRTPVQHISAPDPSGSADRGSNHKPPASIPLSTAGVIRLGSDKLRRIAQIHGHSPSLSMQQSKSNLLI